MRILTKMKKRVSRKFKSERGASLSIAILLFMVCAVLGGIILASATAASGRLKNLVESDKRYYSVTSAAQLLAKELSESKVVIERAKTSYQFTDAAGEEVTDPPTGEALPADVYKIQTLEANNTYNSFDECSFLAQAANSLLFGSHADDAYNPAGGAGGADGAGGAGASPEITEDDVWNASFSTDSADPEDEATPIVTQSFKMKLQTNRNVLDDGSNLCKVQCEVKVQPDGTIVSDIWNVNDDETNHDDEFTLRLVMRPDYMETQTDEVLGAVPVSAAGRGTVFRTQKKTTKTSTISWFVLSVKKMEKVKSE